jgi:hypothetical protein
MLIKKAILALLALFSIYSAETNAATLLGNKCTLGLLPFGTTMAIDAKKELIIKAYEDKGYFVTVLNKVSDVHDVEFISDASVECTSTYFGIFAKTQVRLIETSTNKILSRSETKGVMDLWTCKIELFEAIESLPVCQIK